MIGKGEKIVENDFVIQTEISIEDFINIMDIIKRSLQHTEDVNEMKQKIRLYEKIETLVKQFKIEKENNQ